MRKHESVDGVPLYGVAAEFASPDALVAAARTLRGGGFGRLEAFTPRPVPDLDPILDMNTNFMAGIALVGWLLGACGFFALAVYATVFDYRFNVGGRPLLSWPYYIVPSCAAGVLVAVVLVTLGLSALCRLPRLNHPAFNIDHFERATRDRFFLVVEARHDSFDPGAVEAAFKGLALRPLTTRRVPR